ncbi:MAG: SGNH/GDSL hydrolase family protein [Deltaproteobacteria bacterium]|nr:SGNH/GDSL hydrolase family protein [Deltaproteobacteria bacterium]
MNLSVLPDMKPRSKWNNKINQWAKPWATFSSITTVTFVIFALLNLGLWLAFACRDYQGSRRLASENDNRLRTRPGQPKWNPRRNGYQMWYSDLRSYENVDPLKVEQVLDDFSDYVQQGYVFRPYVHYSQPTFQSATVNFQRNAQGFEFRRGASDWAQGAKKIFIFGGSTALGYHVADEWTLPYLLEVLLNRGKSARSIRTHVVNFGRVDYSWYQEYILLGRLLHAGLRPDAVIFVDGVNVFKNGPENIPVWTEKLQQMWDSTQFLSGSSSLPHQIPLFRLINYIQKKRDGDYFDPLFKSRNPAAAEYSDEQKTILMKESYLLTMKMIHALAKSFDIKTHFIWQPHRAYRCETEKYARPLPTNYEREAQALYRSMEKVVLNNFYNLSHECEKMAGRMIFIDDLHYSPDLNRVLASEIASIVRNK